MARRPRTSAERALGVVSCRLLREARATQDKSATDGCACGIVEADGDPIAARLGYRFRGVESGYQGGWGATYTDYSIASCSLPTRGSAHADGMQEYKFLRGDAVYKYRFATAGPGLETVTFSRDGISGLAMAGAALTDTPVPGYVRTKLDRSA